MEPRYKCHRPYQVLPGYKKNPRLRRDKDFVGKLPEQESEVLQRIRKGVGFDERFDLYRELLEEHGWGLAKLRRMHDHLGTDHPFPL